MTKKEKRIAHLCIVVFILCICFLCWYDADNVYALSDKQIVQKYVDKHYPEYNIKYVPMGSDKLNHRTKYKHTVLVEKIYSISTGHKDKRNKMYYGKIINDSKYYCWYNTKVRKGKKVVQYLVYNPKNNYCDDVVLVVDSKKSR